MKDLTVEIEKAVPLAITFVEAIIVDYAINKRGYDFDWDYCDGMNTLEIYKDNEIIGVLLTNFPLGFVLEKYYDDFQDLKQYYHLTKVNSFGEEEWCLDVKRMKEIAPGIKWIYDDNCEPIDISKFCIADFEYCVH